jgi:sigma-B regulation protein RsbU (phosphoserine phosphatase)
MDFPEGSKLLVYTDGLTEAENEERKLFGEDRLTSIMQKIGKSSPREIIESLDGYVKQFTDGTEQSDDLTILCISKVKNVNRIVLKNDMKEVARLKGFMRETSSMIGFSEDMLLSLNLAVEEAVVNVINYAYPEGVEGDIELCAYKTSDSVVFELKDQGIAFDPTKVGEADTTSDLDERQIGGLGIFLTKEMMDIVEYRRDGNTNILTMKKTIMS